MNDRQRNSVIKYTIDMASRAGEYDFAGEEMLEASKEDGELGDIYSTVLEENNLLITICNECEREKLFDSDAEEFYCPMHDEGYK